MKKRARDERDWMIVSEVGFVVERAFETAQGVDTAAGSRWERS